MRPARLGLVGVGHTQVRVADGVAVVGIDDEWAEFGNIGCVETARVAQGEVVVLLGGVAGVDGRNKSKIVLVEVARRDVVFALQPLVLATQAAFESQPTNLLLDGDIESQVGLTVVKDVATQGIALIDATDKGVKVMCLVLRLIMSCRSCYRGECSRRKGRFYFPTGQDCYDE